MRVNSTRKKENKSMPKQDTSHFLARLVQKKIIKREILFASSFQSVTVLFSSPANSISIDPSAS